MEYRKMGKWGLKLSELSLGAWVTYGGQVGEEIAEQCMVAAYEAGVNFFDNAETYANGNAEIVMGNVLQRVGWRRESYVVSTKIFWGGKGPNDRGLSYKHVYEGVNNALRRLQLDYVDLVFCHRPDRNTPIEETVWAMDQVIRQGKALYWGTSEWSAADIIEADKLARLNGLRPPSMEQPQYNMLHRDRFEMEYEPLFRNLGYGTTIWSPLASGLLTGKYNQGVPQGSRASLPGYEWLAKTMLRPEAIEKARQLQPIADDLGCTMAQMALAWCLLNPNVSTVITGASRVEQVHENLKALKVLPKLTPDVVQRIEDVLQNRPELDDF
ncbi:potassium channel beta subunit family protein [Levilinea saccharolytica]|uniref:Alcohol dehydrogenase n=1 Tax=Levilinea saccharolytica TaxID=229921 RepID=A0A0M9U2Y8_9CHLR|nr:aldo/keto reductase [Levilinea saccharolytica]KPL91507.1 alcohol dehydrogenase [Levilinea saccharolytica]GAP19184.1 voltage-dependent potassium channel beta subunit, animal [Levilinea saccharolytica]